MTTADKGTARALANERKRHEETILASAERMQEHLGYLIKRVHSGHPLTDYDLVGDAVTIRERVASLGTLGYVTKIYEAQEEVPE